MNHKHVLVVVAVVQEGMMSSESCGTFSFHRLVGVFLVHQSCSSLLFVYLLKGICGFLYAFSVIICRNFVMFPNKKEGTLFCQERHPYSST
ncbi:hypothetical protein AQUCO_00400455v1 [Aquilegia coerulea]|uniref:Uncharacterized protein n=1 Tax=Aquilegia coerulea TaxID=218851 RepID=A0A2G5EUY7_AQUCA|nr:hypothetical protein AQUCO_00400455v1 [Aquilegia coerulea]